MFYLNQLVKTAQRSHRVPPYNLALICDFLIVASAGSAGVGLVSYGGGGGAGGLVCSGQALAGGGGSAHASIFLRVGTHSIVVAGETAGVQGQYYGMQGSNSSAFGYTAIGGGAAGGASANPPGAAGGSGGGGAGGDYGWQTGGGLGTLNQGYGGGISGSNAGSGQYGASGGGGGGGAGGTGGNAFTNPSGNAQHYQAAGAGGLGLLWVDGKVYACGGPGGAGGTTGNLAGAHAANYPSGGEPNRGFGGDIGRTDNKSSIRGYGGAGVVIIRYASNQGITTYGGTKTTSVGYTFVTFTTSATLTVA